MCNVQLVNSQLILFWHEDYLDWVDCILDSEKVHIWDVEKGKPKMADIALETTQDLKISGNGSKIFSLHGWFIQALSMETGECVGFVELEELMFRDSSLWMIQESGFTPLHQGLWGGTLKPLACPLFSYLIHPHHTCTTLICGILDYLRSRTKLLEGWFFSLVGGLQSLHMHSGMASIWLLVITLGRY